MPLPSNCVHFVELVSREAGLRYHSESYVAISMVDAGTGDREMKSKKDISLTVT